MKKIILMVVVGIMTMAMFSNCSSNANEQKNEEIFNSWQTTKMEADELTGAKEETMFYYMTKEGIVVVSSNDNEPLMFQTFDGIFGYDLRRFGKLAKKVTIGLYDIDGNLIKKLEGIHCLVADDSSICTIFSILLNNKINSFIKTKKGFVRIVADRFAKADFDIKVPCINN